MPSQHHKELEVLANYLIKQRGFTKEEASSFLSSSRNQGWVERMSGQLPVRSSKDEYLDDTVGIGEGARILDALEPSVAEPLVWWKHGDVRLRTLGDVAAHPRATIESIPGIGATRIWLVVQALEARGLTFQPEQEGG